MSKSMRTELGKVRGLGSAHHGVRHWWAQRLSSIALLPLCLWFIYAVLGIAHAGGDAGGAYAQAHSLIAQPTNALMAALLTACLFYHLQLGMQVIIEDYVPNTAAKLTSLILLNLFCFVVASACIFSLLKISLG